MVSCYFAMIAQREARRGARRTGEAAICIMSVAKTQFKRDWFILTSLVSKDFKLKYRRSVLGVLWSVLNPLLMMIVLSAVFSVVFRGSVDGPFPVYLILGMTLFTFMSDATSGAMGSIIDSAPLIKKIRINKMLFPLEKVLFALLSYATLGRHFDGLDVCDASVLLRRYTSGLDGKRHAIQSDVLLRHVLPRRRHVRHHSEPYAKHHMLRMRGNRARHWRPCIPQAAKEIHTVRLETKVRYARNSQHFSTG